MDSANIAAMANTHLWFERTVFVQRLPEEPRTCLFIYLFILIYLDGKQGKRLKAHYCICLHKILHPVL